MSGYNSIPPVNHVPGSQSVNEDAALIFSAGNGNPLSVSDLADPYYFTVTLSVLHGTLTLSDTTGLHFIFGGPPPNGDGTGDGTADRIMTFYGTGPAVNAALEGLLYQPDANYAGPDTLTITTNDQGVDGLSNQSSDTDSVPIAINAVSNDPAVAHNDAFTTNELTTVAGSLFADNGSGADSDPDGPALAISAVNGSAGDEHAFERQLHLHVGRRRHRDR